MGFQYDVKAKTMTVTGATGIGTPRARIKAVYYCPSGAGAISFKDGGVAGTEKLLLTIGAAGTGSTYILIPGDGVVFEADPYITISGATSVTFFYA